MSHKTYSFKQQTQDRYTFTSSGRAKIKKVVDFTPLEEANITNMGFGDLLPDNSIDDTANSNNGDMIKVLATVVEILKDFTARNPKIEILFTGSTTDRTRLYTRILKTYHTEFNKNFQIAAIIKSGTTQERIPFDPSLSIEYLAFLVKRIY